MSSILPLWKIYILVSFSYTSKNYVTSRHTIDSYNDEVRYRWIKYYIADMVSTTFGIYVDGLKSHDINFKLNNWLTLNTYIAG